MNSETATLAPIKSHPEFAGILREQEIFATGADEGLSEQLNVSFDKLMLQAGLEISPTTVLMLCFCSGIGIGGLVFVIQENLLSTCIGTALGFALPIAWAAIAQELRIVADQARIGTLEHALQNLNERVDVPDVHSFTTLLIQTDQMGTSISAALADYAQNMRESLRQRADEKASQATFKLLFPIVLCLMPAVYMFLLGPAIVELSDFFNGGNRALENAAQAVQRYNNPSSGR